MHGNKTDLNAIFRYFNEAYCNFFVNVFKIHEICYFCLLVFFFVFFFSIDNKKSIQGLILHKIGMIAVNMRYITAIDP